MFRLFTLALFCSSSAFAQTCPTRPQNDSSNACSSTAYADRAALATNAISALTGDVAATGPGSVIATIQAGAVTAAKLASGAAASNIGSLGGALGGTLPNPSMAAGAAATNVGTLGGDLSGTLPSPSVASGAITNAKQAAMIQNAVKGAASSTSVADLSVPSCSASTSALTWTTNSGFGCNSSITASLSFANNSLGADVALNNTANYFDGPSVAQGSTGTWFASGTVTLSDTAGSAAIFCKLWDGTTIISSGVANSTAANVVVNLALSGILATPAANIKISCRDVNSASGKIIFNTSGNSKDSTLTAIRIQ